MVVVLHWYLDFSFYTDVMHMDSLLLCSDQKLFDIPSWYNTHYLLALLTSIL